MKRSLARQRMAQETEHGRVAVLSVSNHIVQPRIGQISPRRNEIQMFSPPPYNEIVKSVSEKVDNDDPPPAYSKVVA